MNGKYKWTIRFAILTVVLSIICFMFIGGGHGSYTPLMIFFPYATFNTMWQDALSEEIVAIGIFQFLVYGFLIDISKSEKARNITLVSIIIPHTILVTLILIFRGGGWK